MTDAGPPTGALTRFASMGKAAAQLGLVANVAAVIVKVAEHGLDCTQLPDAAAGHDLPGP